MDVIRKLVDKNCTALNGTFRLIKVGSWYFWKYEKMAGNYPIIYLDLAPYAKNRGLSVSFYLVPLEDKHFEVHDN